MAEGKDEGTNGHRAFACLLIVSNHISHQAGEREACCVAEAIKSGDAAGRDQEFEQLFDLLEKPSP